MSRFAPKMDALFTRTFVPRFTGKIVDWCRQWIKLRSEESGDFPGDYDPDLNPLPTVLFDLYQSGEYDEVVVIKSSQSGWTMAFFAFICWFVTYVKRNFIYALDSEEEVEKVSETRLQPMIEDCAPANAKVRAGKSPFTKVMLRFNGLIGYLTGGESLGKVSNKSAGLVVIDESAALEKRVAKATIKANLKELRARLKKQSTGFLGHISKAGDWEGEINQEYLRGTRHKCFVPCPHCTETAGKLDGFQVIEWEQIKFGHCKDDRGHYDIARVMRETYLECIHCRGKIVEDQKAWMVNHREWRQTYFGEDPAYPLEPRRASLENTDFYSTFPTLTWGKLAAGYISCLGDAEAMKNWWRDHAARPSREKAVQVDENILYKMTAGYKRGECPVLPRKVLMSADHQQTDRTWPWMKTAFNWEGDCWVVDWGVALNAEALTDIANQPVIIKNWPAHVPTELRINPVVFKGLVDERFDQKTVRDFIISTITSWGGDGTPDYRFHACYGLAQHTARSLKDIVSPGAIAKPNAFHNQMPIWSYAISTDAFNKEIYTKRYGQFRKIVAAMNAGGEVPSGIRRIYFPECIQGREHGDEAKLVRQLTREVFWFNPAKQRWEWKDVKDNDWGDCLRMCFALWYLLAPLEQAPLPLTHDDEPVQKEREYLMRPRS